jgi:hypothetical protein
MTNSQSVHEIAPAALGFVFMRRGKDAGLPALLP